jgi:hypothetical protein
MPDPAVVTVLDPARGAVFESRFAAAFASRGGAAFASRGGAAFASRFAAAFALSDGLELEALELGVVVGRLLEAGSGSGWQAVPSSASRHSRRREGNDLIMGHPFISKRS